MGRRPWNLPLDDMADTLTSLVSSLIGWQKKEEECCALALARMRCSALTGANRMSCVPVFFRTSLAGRVAAGEHQTPVRDPVVPGSPRQAITPPVR